MQSGGAGTVVRPVVASDVAVLCDVLVRSFDDDPVSNFMFGGDRRRRGGLRSFFTAQLRHQYLPHGHVFTTDDLGAAALWGAPDASRNGWAELVHLLPTAPFLVGRRTVRALRLLFEVDGLRPREPHWYLATLGTDPPRQGHGLGSALMESMLPRIDESGHTAYLESSKERNVPFYARFGFEVIGEVRSSVGGPTIWRMQRQPRIPTL